MSVLDAFLPENSRPDSVFVFITGYGMTFSKSAVNLLGYPPFVRVYFDRKGKRMALTPCPEEEGARRFAKDPGTPRAGFVRWNDHRLLMQVCALGEIRTEGEGVRVQGEYYPEENVLVFNLKQTVPIRHRNAREQDP